MPLKRQQFDMRPQANSSRRPRAKRKAVEYLVPEKPISKMIGEFRSALGLRIKPIPNAVWFMACTVLLVLVVELLSLGLSAAGDKKQILGVATSAYTDLNSATANLGANDFQNALSLFESARGSLQSASDRVSGYKLLSWAVPQAKSAENVLRGAYLLAESGKNLTSAMQAFDTVKVNKNGFEQQSLGDFLVSNRQLLADSLDKLTEADRLFAEASALPSEYSATVAAGRGQVQALTAALGELVSLEDVYLAVVGGGPKTYLLVFENYDEMRATGGFIGTYGVFRFENGRIARMKVESVYNLDGSIHQRIAAPGPFQPAIQKWGMRDANWFVDFPQSAEKLLKFYELGKETADGVIAMTPKLFVDILNITGPIEMPDYQTTLTAENFQTVVQQKTSVEYDKALNQPKKFLADFVPVLLDRLSGLDQRQKLALFQAVTDAFKTKHILIYSRNSEDQAKLLRLGFAGEVKNTDFDYLAIFNSNMGGTKTDLSVEQKASLKSKILSDGSVLNKLQITRQNNDAERNLDFIRILVPKGSILVSAAGFDDKPLNRSASEGYATDPDLFKWDGGGSSGSVYRTEEAGKTEFAGWIEIGPKEGKTLTLNYILPFKVQRQLLSGKATYSLLYQKQPGATNASLTAALDFGDYSVDWSTSGMPVGAKSATLAADSGTDRFWSFILKHD